MANGLMNAARLFSKRLFNVLPARAEEESKRAYTKRVIAETTEEAYEVVCGVAGCVLKEKEP